MHLAARIALAVVILLVDFVSFLVPLGSLVIAWVILARPRWALDFVDRVYAGVDIESGTSVGIISAVAIVARSRVGRSSIR